MAGCRWLRFRRGHRSCRPSAERVETGLSLAVRGRSTAANDDQRQSQAHEPTARDQQNHSSPRSLARPRARRSKRSRVSPLPPVFRPGGGFSHPAGRSGPRRADARADMVVRDAPAVLGLHQPSPWRVEKALRTVIREAPKWSTRSAWRAASRPRGIDPARPQRPKAALPAAWAAIACRSLRL